MSGPGDPTREAAGELADEDRAEMDSRPPILGSWRNIYVLVLVSQAVLILLFYWLTVAVR